MPVAYTFATRTSSIPLSELDSNFATSITLGNTAIQLGNVVTTLNNMTFVTPALGTPSAGVLTNCTGLPLTTGVTGTLPVANGGTGITAFGTGVATALGQNVTGSGGIALATSPSFTTPTLGVATATSVNKVTITAPATSATLTIADGKTFISNNSITLAGTDSTVMTFPPATANVGYLNIPLNSQSANYTTLAADAGKTILHPLSDNNARTFTIDSNANVSFETGTAITFINLANTVTISILSDTMYLASTGSTGSRTLAAFGVATAVKVGTTSWIISGNGLS